MTPREKVLELLQKFRLIDDTFMACVFDDIPCTQYVLDILLAPKKVIVRSVQVHHELKAPGGQSVILDIYAEDSAGRQYDIEVQRASRGASGNRAMVYTGMLMASSGHHKEDYGDIPETYVIFITEKDVFRQKLPLLHFHERADETGTRMGEKASIIFVNGAYRNENDAVGRLMQDFMCQSPAEMHPSPLRKKTMRLKESEKEADNMCKLWEDALKEMHEDGKAEGKAEGKVEGKAEGERQATLESVKTILRMHWATPEQVADNFKLPLDQVKQLAAEVQ